MGVFSWINKGISRLSYQNTPMLPITTIKNTKKGVLSIVFFDVLQHKLIFIWLFLSTSLVCIKYFIFLICRSGSGAQALVLLGAILGRPGAETTGTRPWMFYKAGPGDAPQWTWFTRENSVLGSLCLNTGSQNVNFSFLTKLAAIKVKMVPSIDII